jgi:hypothetical protein
LEHLPGEQSAIGVSERGEIQPSRRDLVTRIVAPSFEQRRSAEPDNQEVTVPKLTDEVDKDIKGFVVGPVQIFERQYEGVAPRSAARYDVR